MIQKIKIDAEAFDGIAEVHKPKTHGFWGSARMTYTICAFLAMVLHLCMRNTLNFVILCMVKPDPAEDANKRSNFLLQTHFCGALNGDDNSTIGRAGELPWTRSQEFSLQGTFYYGYLITLPIAGRLADQFGGKLLFVHSITAQAAVLMLTPVLARMSYWAAVAIRVLQGLIAGCGNPALYQLFSTWAHPTERTSLLSFAYGGYAVGSLLIFPISGMLCRLGWDVAFYVVGSISLLFGISFQWLVYSSLEEHPRLSREEYEYLKEANDRKSKPTEIPWKSILTSLPVYAFTLTHIFHTYGIIVLTLMMPRFLKEAMDFSLDQVGILASAPFLGAFISKALTVSFCTSLEQRANLNLTKFRRILYVIGNCATIAFIVGIIASDCRHRVFVVFLCLCIGITTDISFSGAYWPSLLFMAPSYAGLLSGISNCLATFSGFLAPIGISKIAEMGTNLEWDYVMMTLIIAYLLGAGVYGFFGSSKLESWNNTQ